MNKRKEEHPWAEMAGQGFAHLQHGMDKLTEWGLKKMKEAGTDEKEEMVTEGNKYLRALTNAGKGTLHFLGRTGEEYYKEYEKLKQKKHSK